MNFFFFYIFLKNKIKKMSDEFENNIINTQNIIIEFEEIEKKGTKIKFSSDEENNFEGISKKNKNKVKIDNSGISVYSNAKTSVTKYTSNSKLSKAPRSEADRLSQAFSKLNLGIGEDEFEFDAQKSAEAYYHLMLNNRFSKILENRKKIHEDIKNNERFNLKKEDLFKMPRQKLIKENIKIKKKIKKLK